MIETATKISKIAAVHLKSRTILGVSIWPSASLIDAMKHETATKIMETAAAAAEMKVRESIFSRAQRGAKEMISTRKMTDSR